MTAVELYPNLKVPCPNEDLGCSWKGCLKDLEGHTVPCEKKLFRAAIIDIHMLKAKLENKDREIHFLKNDFELKIQKISKERFVKKKEKLEKVKNHTEKIGEIVYAKMEEIAAENVKQKEEIENLKKEVEELKKAKEEESKNFRPELQELKNENQKLKSKPSEVKESEIIAKGSEINQGSAFATTLHQNPTPPQKTGNVFLDMCIDGTNIGRIEIDLFHDQTPKTCLKFTQLCNHAIGVGYKGSKVNVIYDNYCVIGSEKDLTYPSSSTKPFPHQFITPVEKTSVKHDERGVSMVNWGGSTKSYFRIMFKSHPSLDRSEVIIGKVTEGTWPICKRIKACNVTTGGTPKQCITIDRCGVVD